MNSVYGVMALPTFRLYTHEIAEAITRHGREIIEHTKNVVEDNGYTVVYGDTDSVFVSGISDTNRAVDLESAINDRYNEYASAHSLVNHRLRIEFEAFSPVMLLVKKKRYAMRLDNGENKIAGFQLKRSDTQPLARTMQERVINYILDGAKAPEVISWYEDHKTMVLNGELDKQIGIPRKFTKKLEEYKSNYAVNGALYSNEHLNKNISAGDKVVTYHIKSTTFGFPSTTSIALEYEEDIPKQFHIDRKKHWDRIDKALFPLLDDAKLIQKTKQSGLEDFL
jgi:DNA polymerase elongation subunit (family B)